MLMLLLGAGMCLAGWERTFGGIGNDAATSVVLGEDGGYVVAGYWTEGYWVVDTTIFGSDTLYDSTYVSEDKAFAMKLDESGDSVWAHIYDTEYFSLYNMLPKIVRVTGSGYAILFGTMDKCIIRTDNLGNELWRSTLSGYIRNFASTSDGGFVFTGKTSSPSDMLLDKRDSLCNPEWTEEYGGSDDESGYAVAQTSDGGYIIAGMTETWGSYWHNTWVVRTDSLGIALWAKVYGENGAWSIIETDDGGFAFIETPHIPSILYRINCDGDTLWTRQLVPLYECIESEDGNLVVVGNNGSDLFLSKINDDGDTLWTRTYGGSEPDYGYSVRQTSDGGYIIAGRTESFGAGERDVYLIKTDSLGYTAIGEAQIGARPENISISAYPNPFNSAVRISVDCHSRENGNPEIEIFDINGRMVADLSVGEGLRPSRSSHTTKTGGSKTTPLQIEIFDVRGNVILNRALQGAGNKIIWRPAQTISSGVYLVRAKMGGNDKGLKPLVAKRIVYLK